MPIIIIFHLDINYKSRICVSDFLQLSQKFKKYVTFTVQMSFFGQQSFISAKVY